jgi:hypothetical protein
VLGETPAQAGVSARRGVGQVGGRHVVGAILPVGIGKDQLWEGIGGGRGGAVAIKLAQDPFQAGPWRSHPRGAVVPDQIQGAGQVCPDLGKPLEKASA